jgi:hypothetical protein
LNTLWDSLDDLVSPPNTNAIFLAILTTINLLKGTGNLSVSV